MTLTRRPTLPRAAGLTPLALALSLGFAASAAQAQSLKDLYEAARAYDATYLGARAQADSAQYRVGQARAGLLPQVNLTAGASRTEADTPYTQPKSTNTDAAQVGITAQQVLFNRSTSIQVDQAERGVEVSQSQLRAAEQDLIVRVAQAYFDVLASTDALGTVQASKKAISEQLASAKRNFEVGTATITDTREAQARYDLALAQELAAENDLRVKRVALEQLVGRPGATPRPLALPVALPPIAPANVDDWASGAVTRSPVVQQAELGLQVAKLETEKARAGHLPTVGLTGGYTKQHVSVDASTGAGTQSVSGTGSNATIGVSVTVPLFSGFYVQNRVKETLALEEKARNDLDVARRGVDQGTRQAFFGVQSGRGQVKALEAAEASSKLALEATLLGYKVGVRVNLDVLNAQTQLFTTQRDLAKARYDVIVGDLKLRQAAGQLQPTDVDAANALLAP